MESWYLELQLIIPPSPVEFGNKKMQHIGLISPWKKHSGGDSFRHGPCGLAGTISFPLEFVRLLLPILLDNHKLFPKRREQTRTRRGMCRHLNVQRLWSSYVLLPWLPTLEMTE